ncbi:MAG: glycosyltransferase family 2 protein, partial [Ilumatobacteraceae bacterium]
YVPALARRAITGGRAGRVALADAALDQVVPPFSILVVSSSAWAMAAGARMLLRPGPRARRDLVRATTVASAQVTYLLIALALVRAPRHVYRALLGAPRFVVWKLGLWLGVLRPDADVHWTRTARN